MQLLNLQQLHGVLCDFQQQMLRPVSTPAEFLTTFRLRHSPRENAICLNLLKTGESIKSIADF